MFKLETDFAPKGDQPNAIKALSEGVKKGQKSQVLLGITGSGKTFTMANVIESVQRPTLILAHNKTLAAQLYQEFRSFFPQNAVEYFVSYYDYYQPEAYIPRTDTYIEKDLAINDQIDRMRLSATRALLEREDVIIVSSVSCIYGLGSPENYAKMIITIEKGEQILRDDLLIHLIKLHYTRNDMELARGTFRVRGDILEIVPAYESDIAYRIEFFGDEIERISEIDPLTGKTKKTMTSLSIYPGSHYVTPDDIRYGAIQSIEKELEERISYFKEKNALIEEQRIRERTKYDLEMIKEIGFCKGIENYSRHFSNRPPGASPPTLIDYFPKDFLFFIDESHQTVPQVRAMYNGDRARKETLINYGFRLPSAFDNRPLKFEEFYEKLHSVIYVSATPNPWEVEEAKGEIVHQIIRPTGLLDPICEVRKAEFQVDDCMEEIQKEIAKGGRILVTTLTKKLSEDLSNYLKEVGVKAKYLHSDIDTLERIQIIKELRDGKFDVLVGINLLREGLDIPEVSLVTILDADKEGFLRSETSLIQTAGRAARNVSGRVILYADKITKSIAACLEITQNRRKIQEEYNKTHKITPKTASRKKAETLLESFGILETPEETTPVKLTPKALSKKIKELESSMIQAAQKLNFEEAAKFRDELRSLRSLELLEDF
jgi:excinuclease ABC subunit B